MVKLCKCHSVPTNHKCFRHLSSTKDHFCHSLHFCPAVNRFSPVFQQSLYSYTIPENSPIGTSVLLVTATDDDSPASPDGQVTYSLNQPKFTIDRSGWVILASNLDILQQAVYNFTVLAWTEVSLQELGQPLW